MVGSVLRIDVAAACAFRKASSESCAFLTRDAACACLVDLWGIGRGLEQRSEQLTGHPPNGLQTFTRSDVI